MGQQSTNLKIMNRINQLFQQKKQNILSLFTTAGYPKLNDTVPIVTELAHSGVDMIEIGMPFTDPLADGPVIQQSSHVALENGMSIKVMFEQLKGIRDNVQVPLILMGYLNPVMQFGIENFLKKCVETGIDGVILPDLPLREYQEEYQSLFEKYGIRNIFLITPQSTEERIRKIDECSNGFIYMVSSSSTTGAKSNIEAYQLDYFKRITAMKLKNPCIIGFGISSRETFTKACQYSNGAIIASAFIRDILSKDDWKDNINTFVKSIRN
jgi:tryptophan synthase alpha chain